MVDNIPTPFKVVITGASGFIGLALFKEYSKKGVSVTGLSRGKKKGLTTISSYSNFNFDYSDEAVLIHLAQPRDASNPSDGTEIAICRSLATKPWHHIIYASSSIVYGDKKNYPRKPDEKVSAINEYAQVKLECESIVTGVGGTCLRFVNIYGPGMAPNSVMSDILRQIPGKGPLLVRDKTPVRDFLWIEDAVHCLLSASIIKPGGIFNVGSGNGCSIEKICKIALDIAGEKERLVVSKNDSQIQSNLILDISKTSSILNWFPEVDIQLGLSILLKMKKNND